MDTTLKIVQLIISVVLIILIMLQSNSTGLSSSVKSNFSAYRSVRGLEKIILISTIVLGFALVINSVLLIAL